MSLDAVADVDTTPATKFTFRPNTRMRIRPWMFTAIVISSLVPIASRAQSSAPAVPARPDSAFTPVRNDLLLVNPFGLVFSALAGEYEHVTSRRSSVGVGGTYFSQDDFTYATLEVKARYYPSEHAPDGFSVGVTGGVTRQSDNYGYCFDVCLSARSNRPTAGFELDYNWILGPTRRFVVGTGIGAKRFFGDNTTGGIDGIPTARVAIGVAF